MRPWQIGAIVAATALVGILAGVWLTSQRDAAASSDPVPPCPTGWFVSYDPAKCQPTDEGCYSFLNGQDAKTVSCSARSPDGEGALRINLQGSGIVRIVVTDGAGKTILSRSESFSAGLLPIVELEGASGTWKLTTTYDAQGSANIQLWG